jgi:hypothetical protein
MSIVALAHEQEVASVRPQLVRLGVKYLERPKVGLARPRGRPNTVVVLDLLIDSLFVDDFGEVRLDLGRGSNGSSHPGLVGEPKGVEVRVGAYTGAGIRRVKLVEVP